METTRCVAKSTQSKVKWDLEEKQQLVTCLTCEQEDSPNSWNLHKKAKHNPIHIGNLSTGEGKTGEFLEFIGQTA